MDYIEDCGCIREETFDRMVASIEKGECPHFSAAPLERTNETTCSVSAIHIAAATGCMAAFNDHLCYLRYMKSGIFNLTPYAIATIKGKSECIGLFSTNFVETLHHLFAYSMRRGQHIIRM